MHLKKMIFLKVIIKLLSLKKWCTCYSIIIAFLTTDNSIKIFTDGHAKFDALIEDIQNAKDYIHIQYYIFKSDGLGRRILKALEDRLEDGIEVKMLYDDMGSRTLRKKDLKQFKDKGGHAKAFFPSKLPLINLRMNNRNHRKIVIIDGKIGYVGGLMLVMNTLVKIKIWLLERYSFKT